MKETRCFEKISAGAISPAMPSCVAVVVNAGGSQEVMEYLQQMYYAQEFKVYLTETSLEKLPQVLARCHEAGIPAIVNCGKALPPAAALLPTDTPYTASVVSPGSYGEMTDGTPDIISYVINDNWAAHAACIGYQGYYFSPDKSRKLRERYFEQMRLGELREGISTVEPVVRESRYTFLDFNAVRHSDYPAPWNTYPNGMYAEEICTLARYIGFGVALKGVFLHSTPSSQESLPICNRLVAETIWHLCQALASNIIETPAADGDDEHFIRKIISLEGNNEQMVFINSSTTDRWWFEISVPEYKKTILVPCSINDYKSACCGDIPLRWLFFYQKYSIL